MRLLRYSSACSAGFVDTRRHVADSVSPTYGCEKALFNVASSPALSNRQSLCSSTPYMAGMTSYVFALTHLPALPSTEQPGSVQSSTHTADHVCNAYTLFSGEISRVQKIVPWSQGLVVVSSLTQWTCYIQTSPPRRAAHTL